MSATSTTAVQNSAMLILLRFPHCFRLRYIRTKPRIKSTTANPRNQTRYVPVQATAPAKPAPRKLRGRQHASVVSAAATAARGVVRSITLNVCSLLLSGGRDCTTDRCLVRNARAVRVKATSEAKCGSWVRFNIVAVNSNGWRPRKPERLSFTFGMNWDLTNIGRHRFRRQYADNRLQGRLMVRAARNIKHFDFHFSAFSNTGQGQGLCLRRLLSSSLHFFRSASSSLSSCLSCRAFARVAVSFSCNSCLTVSQASVFRPRRATNSRISRSENPRACIWRIKRTRSRSRGL
jgi:hypothetical protein